MSADWQPLGRLLLLIGLLLVISGMVLVAAPRLPWLGRLPGDVLIQRDRFTFYLPLGSCLLASLLLSLFFWIMNRWRS